MDYSQFLYMKEEISLIAVILIILLVDLFINPKKRKSSANVRLAALLPIILMTIHTLINIVPSPATFSAFGGMFQYTPMHTVIKAVLNVGAILVLLMSPEWLKRDDVSVNRGEFCILTLSTLLGMYFMISAGHFLMFFLGLETASIPMAALAAFNKFRYESAEAGAKYILTAMFSSALLLFGISFVYGACGTLYFDEIPTHLNEEYLSIMAFVFFFAGMGFKLSLVPFHLWTADVYEGAPTPVTGYLSVVSKGSAAFVLMTILVKVFSPIMGDWHQVLFWIIVVTITLANIFAVRQKNLKRLMAFSSISQAGYIMLGVISGNAAGMTSLVYYILVYTVANLAIFSIISIIEQRSGKLTLDDYAGLYKTNPKLSFIMTLALFSLAGIPPFAGFFSKFFIFMAAFKGNELLVFIALVNTIISLYYYLLIVKAMYITPSDHPITSFKSDCYTKVGLIFCLIGIVGLGIASIVYQTIGKFSIGL
jgi:NADH-quinone oxidoreductase subunit N